MSKSKEYELAIKIAGEVEKSFYESTKLTKNELKAIAKQAASTAMAAEASYGSFGSAISKGLKDAEPAFSGLERAAQASFKGLVTMAGTAGAGISAALIASINVGSEFESAFAGVKKTVNATDYELNQMRDDLRQMAREELPLSAAELSEIAESAGQLGIHTPNITEFAKTMANMDVATNLSSDESATEFAQFANIVDMSQDKFENLGSSVVALGNNMATTEADIMSMGMRIAAAGNQVGLTEADILGYSAALSSVGIEAEAGGSAFSKLLTKLQLAAETGENLKEYAKVSGMTETEFKKTFSEDATAAINAFLSGLNNTERNGKSAIAVLDDMGLTEVRLRDTLIRAANASDMFENALTLSSEAFEENTALAKEAEQRYKTLESQSEMTKNKITDIGISIYDDLRPGLTEGIGLVNGFIDALAGQEYAVGDMIDSATKKMPTMMRKMREAGEAVQDFAEPFLDIGGWLADNPGVIVGTISGVGTALTAYKVVSGISALAGALGALNPVGMAIMGLGGVAAVITGVATSVKKASNEAKRTNLAAHFGNIALSLSDLQEVAASIVGNESLEQIRESFAAMSELDGISDMISSAANELNRANWKVSIGMELTEQEKQDYQNQVESYIESTREYLEQRQYAINLSANVILGDGAEEAMSTLNEFYAGKMQELSDAEIDLQDAITEAFADGILAPEEAEHIAALQKDVAAIKDSVTGDNLEANLDLLEVKYGNRELDADSTMNLMAEVNSLRSEAMSGYEQAYSELMSDYRQAYNAGGMTQEEFNEAKRNADIGLLTQKSETLEKTTASTTGMIQSAYSEELEEFIPLLKEETRKQLEAALNAVAYDGGSNWLPFLGEDILDSIKVDKSTRDAMAELYELKQPEMEQLQELKQQYIAAGEEIPEWIKEGLSDMGAIGALAGDVDAIWEVIGEAAESEEYQDAIRVISESGGYLPEQIAGAIADNQYMINDAVSQSWQDTKRAYYETFGSGTIAAEIFSSTAPARKFASPLVTTGHADGGIFNTPHVAWFAEDGPEAVIPINKSKNAVDLWVETGELLGMDGLTGGSEPLSAAVEEAALAGQGETVLQIDNSRTIQFYGEAPSRDELEDILETEDEKFAKMMQRYLSNGRRVSFS